MVIRRASEEAARAHFEAARRAEQAARKTETRARRREQFAAATATVGEQLRRLPGQVDAALRTIAGEENDILYRFLQVLTLAFCFLIPAVVLWLVALLIF